MKFRFKHYAVTVMDNWTPWRSFFTYWGALRWSYKHNPAGVYRFVLQKSFGELFWKRL